MRVYFLATNDYKIPNGTLHREEKYFRNKPGMKTKSYLFWNSNNWVCFLQNLNAPKSYFTFLLWLTSREVLSDFKPKSQGGWNKSSGYTCTQTYNSAYIKFVLWFNTCNCQYTLKHKIPLTIHVSLCSSTFETTHTLKCPMISIHLTRPKSKLSASRFYVNIISVHIYAQLHMYISILISMIRRSLTVTWVLFKI